MADPWRQHGAPIPVIYQADVENPDIETVALVTALRALFQLANDHSIEDLPSNANYDAAVEDLTSATHLFIETGKENRHRRGQPDIPRSERLRRPNEDVSRFEFGVCQGRELALSSQASRHLELSKPCLDLLDEVRKTNPKNRNIRSIEECACPSGTIDSSQPFTLHVRLYVRARWQRFESLFVECAPSSPPISAHSPLNNQRY